MTVRVEDIIMMTASAFGVDYVDLVRVGGSRRLVQPRHVAMYVSRQATSFSLPDIARAFDNDHTTVIAAIKKVEARMAEDANFAALVQSLKDAVGYRKMAPDRSGVDTLALARQIAANPRRMAIAASPLEIAALATAVVDVWEVACAAETLVGELGHCDIETHEPERAALVATLIQNITSEMNHIAGSADSPLEPAEAERS